MHVVISDSTNNKCAEPSLKRRCASSDKSLTRMSHRSVSSASRTKERWLLAILSSAHAARASLTSSVNSRWRARTRSGPASFAT